MCWPHASGMTRSCLLWITRTLKGAIMESNRIATLSQPFRRCGLSRRTVLALAGASLSSTLLGRVGLSARNAMAQDATPPAGPVTFLWETRGDPDSPLGNPSKVAVAPD